MPKYQTHALANLFPLIEGHEFDELVNSIKAHGLREPITLYHLTILDGRNRYRACEVAGVEPRFEEFTGDDPYSFVADKNLHRRHLKPGQLSMIAARMATLSVGNPNLNHKTSIVGLPTIGISQADAAKILNISRDTVLNAKVILGEGTPEEIQSVEQGKRGVGALAAEIRARNPSDRTSKGSDHGNTIRKSNAIKAQQMNAKLWQNLRGALEALGNLPKASNMAIIARNISRGNTVDETLDHAVEWLIEFQTAWNEKKETK
jgi:hypothetical protein